MTNHQDGETGAGPDRFGPGVAAWRSGLGLLRDAVRQELVARQIGYHLPADGTLLDVLDAGCGQGTQAIRLARLGHRVVGVDTSPALLDAARRAAGAEPAEVRRRLAFEHGDLLCLGPGHAGAYGLVCCHGVAMYLPSLGGATRALADAAAPGGLVSILTRNRPALAMRAGISGDWAGALGAFDARHYRNRVGISEVRADEPRDVQEAAEGCDLGVVAWYGVRLFTDHLGSVPPGADFDEVIAAEEEAGRRDPYRRLAALTHTVARRPPGEQAPPARARPRTR